MSTEPDASTQTEDGPATLPPEPAVRYITPAPEDYESTPPLRDLTWPVIWVLVAVLLWSVVSNAGWSMPGH